MTIRCGMTSTTTRIPNTMDLDDVGLNSLYALDAESLAALAAQLGKEDDRQAFQSDYEKTKRLVREKLWNENDGIYENRFWNGEFSKRLSPSSFYPMLAGIATAATSGEDGARAPAQIPRNSGGIMWRQRLRATYPAFCRSVLTGVAASGAPRITCSTTPSIAMASTRRPWSSPRKVMPSS